MPPKASKPVSRKPPLVVVVAPTTIAVEDGPFGSELPVTVTDVPENCYVRAQAWLVDDPLKDDNSDVLDYWLTPGDPIKAGPTAHWSGGAANGRARLIQFTITGSVAAQAVIAETTFNVSA